MKKRLLSIINMTLIMTSSLMLSACTTDKGAYMGEQQEAVLEYVEGAELLCLTDSEDEAREIADMYGIEFVEYQMGVATFHTEEDPQAVIKRGLENGYPELSINGISHIMQ